MKKYWQLVTSEPAGLTGELVSKTIEIVATASDSNRVLSMSVEGGGEVLPQFVNDGCVTSSSVVDLSRLASKMDQFDWGDFFFDPTEIGAAALINSSYEEAIACAKVTLRCVDSSEFFIYGHDDGIRARILEEIKVYESKSGAPGELDFPE